MKVKTIFAVGNRIVDSQDEGLIRDFCDTNNIPLLGTIPYDEAVRKSDARGTMLSPTSEGYTRIQKLGEKLLSLVTESL